MKSSTQKEVDLTLPSSRELVCTPDTSGHAGSQEAGLRRMSIVKSPLLIVLMDS